MKIFLVVALTHCLFVGSAQDFEGYYTGNLLTEKTLLVVDKDKKGNDFVELHSSERHSFRLDAFVSDTILKFSLPTLDSSGLEITSIRTENGLQLSFIVSGEKYTTNFEKIRLPGKDPVKSYFEMVIIDRGEKFDPNLVGEWQLIGAFDAKDNAIKDEFYKKNYVTTFLKDGICFEDPRYFFDQDKKHGRPDLFRPGDIPKGNWSTSDSKTLKRTVGAYETENSYKISNDTLRIFSPNDIKLIYIKRR